MVLIGFGQMRTVCCVFVQCASVLYIWIITRFTRGVDGSPAGKLKLTLWRRRSSQ